MGVRFPLGALITGERKMNNEFMLQEADRWRKYEDDIIRDIEAMGTMQESAKPRYFKIMDADGGGKFLIADETTKLGELVGMCGDGHSCAISIVRMTA